MNDSREFQVFALICSGKLSHFLSQSTVIPSPRSMLSRDRSMPFDSWHLFEPQGNVFGNPRPMFNPSQTPFQGILHSTTPCATGAVPVQVTTGQLVAETRESDVMSTERDACETRKR